MTRFGIQFSHGNGPGRQSSPPLKFWTVGKLSDSLLLVGKFLSKKVRIWGFTT